jgi:diguanylate cyclase (GGDEF)-like protein
MDRSSGVQILGRSKAAARSIPYRAGYPALATAEHRAQAALIAGEYHDALSGLPGLDYLPGSLRCLITQARRSHQAVALIALNIDEYRPVCEAFGRTEGNRLIKRVASILRTAAGPEAIAVFAGGTSFVVALGGLASTVAASAPAQRILAAIAQPYDVAGQELQMMACAGISSFPNDGDDYETLLRNCTAAMHEAMAEGPGAIRTHSGNVALDAKRRLRLRADLSRAIANNGLALHYQPQFDLCDGRVSGVEALARWFPSNGRAIEPRVFIPLAEQMGTIGALGALVLQEACKGAATWQAADDSPPILCVNVSTRQIDKSMCAVIRHAIERAQFPPQRLELEITEGSLQGNIERALACLGEWKALGVRIALDDFGTGFSSMSHLSRLPVDRLKLDKSLVYGLPTNRRNAAIVRSIIALGKELDIGVIAEGVETEEQLQMLEDFGCTQVQGYLLARPVPLEAVQGLLSSRWGMRRSHAQALDAATQRLEAL